MTVGEAVSLLRAFTEDRWNAVCGIAPEGEADGIGVSLIVAIGSRESNCRNIVGDGGHGRGWLQIDDRFHQVWLGSHAGCKSGSWQFSYRSALPRGRCPGLTAAAFKAVELLRANTAFGERNRVPDRYLLRFAIAGYNCGASNALRSYREAGIDGVDRRTTGRDYSADVLDRKSAVVGAAHKLDWELDRS